MLSELCELVDMQVVLEETILHMLKGQWCCHRRHVALPQDFRLMINNK